MKLWKNILWKSFVLGNCFLGTVVQAKNNKKHRKRSREWKLAIAAAAGDKVRVKAFIEQGVNVNKRNEFGTTPLVDTAMIGPISTMRQLLVCGADPNKKNKDEEQWAPLHAAISRGSVKRIKLLLDYGADPNTRDADNKTPLMWLITVIAYKNIEKAKGNSAPKKKQSTLGIDEDLWPEAPPYFWNRAHLSPNNINCYFEILDLLIDHGADINAQDKDGDTALHEAFPSIPEYINAQKKYGDRAPHEVFPPSLELFRQRRPQLRLTRTLVAAGADVNIRNNAGETPLDCFYEQLPPVTPDERIRIEEDNILPEYRDEYHLRTEIIELLGGT